MPSFEVRLDKHCTDHPIRFNHAAEPIQTHAYVYNGVNEVDMQRPSARGLAALESRRGSVSESVSKLIYRPGQVADDWESSQ